MGFGILLFVIIMTIMLLFALFSNVLVIYCVFKFKKLRNVTNIFICNLSVSDILLAGFVIPQRIHDIFHKENFFEGTFLCKVVNFCPVFIITSSVYTLVCVSFERHRAIIDSYGLRMTFQKLSMLIFFTWTFALTISIPTLLEYSVLLVDKTTDNITTTYLSCGSQTSRDLSLTNAIFVFMISYVVPVILIFKNYIQVALFVWKKGRRIRDDSGGTTINMANFHLFKNRMKLVKLLVMVAVIFAVAWFPFFIMLLYAKATGTDASENAAGFVNLLLIALATFSTAYNVVLYIIFNPSFKRVIKGVLKCSNNAQTQEEPALNDQTQQTCSLPIPPDRNGVIKLRDDSGRVFTVKSDNSQQMYSSDSNPTPYCTAMEPRRDF